MTAGTRRNGTSKFGSLKRAATARFGGSESQAQDGRDVVDVFGHDEYGDLQNGDSGTYADESFYGYEEPAIQAGDAGHTGDAGQPDHEAELGMNPKHYTGRHASPRGKATRKRVGKVVPVAAVAATLAAGTAAAAYGFSSGGQPQSSQLNAAMSSHSGNITGAKTSAAGNANAAGSGLIKIAKATDSTAAKAAKAAAKASPSAKPTAAATHAAAATSAPATQAAAPATKAAATTLSCNLSYSMLPDNVTAIVSFLLANGYTDNAAAGIAGNMYQESKGDPESEGMGGGGLIGFTPLPSGYVTGNPATDLQTQLNAVLTYNQGWASYLPALNAAASPADAAYIYVTDFERAGIPAASTREASADNVASACGI
ncbi:MAG: phage tail tip lysozyme [Trebonia sp.]